MLNDHWYRQEIGPHALLATWRGMLNRQDIREAGSVTVPYQEMRALLALTAQALQPEQEL